MGHTINPFLVILAAEIKFRRYLAADGPRLPPVYDALMRKTIQVADLLSISYLQSFNLGSMTPIVIDLQAFYAPVSFVDAEMRFQTDGNESSGSTAGQQRQTAAVGDGTRRADDADYWRRMLSGRGRFQTVSVGSLTYCEHLLVDLELNDNDSDIPHEIQESNRGEKHNHFGQLLV